jgi:FKBP-type peptidyl-prolyl cis-trans isomerase
MQFKKVVILSLISLLVVGYSERGLANDTLRIESYLNSKKIKAEKTFEGIFYAINTEGGGAQLRIGDFVKIRYVGKLLTGHVFDQSSKNEAFIFQLGYGQVIKGWDILFPKLKVGTKTTLYIPAELGYGSEGIGTIIPANTPLVFDIEIEAVMNAKQYNDQMRELEDSGRKELYRQVEERFLEDKKQINDYAIAHKLKMQRTESGISYTITKEGKGDNAKEGKTVVFNYEGYLLNDKKFGASKEKMPTTFKLGENKVMEGWEESFKYFNKGSEGYIIIPTRLAYDSLISENTQDEMPAHSVLVFKVQVLDIQ